MHRIVYAALAALLSFAGLSFVGPALAQPAPPATTASASPSPAPDYANPAAWLCRPGRADACSIDQTTTVVAADGSLTRETFTADAAAPIDCFYVYPTVSTDLL